MELLVIKLCETKEINDYDKLNGSIMAISMTADEQSQHKCYSHPTQCITKSKFENCHLKTTESEKQNTDVLFYNVGTTFCEAVIF